jgi:hypothetical protein
MALTEAIDTQDGQFADESAPESVPQQDDAPEYGKNNRDLPEELVTALNGLVKKFQAREMYDRRIEVLMDRILRFYDDGVQHVYPNWGTGVYQVGVSGGYVDTGNGQSIQCPLYMGAYNIFRARRRSLDAVLTQNPPGVDFAPDRPERSEDIEASETAEGYSHLFDQANDIKKMQQDIARMFELSGRCVAWTRTVASKSKFGVNASGEARSMETAKIYGTLESKLPIVCNCFEHAPYIFLYDDLDSLIAKSENDWIKDKITAGEAALGESDWERFARIGIKQAKKGYYLTGLALNHLTTEMNCFLRPAALEDKSLDEPFTKAGEDDVSEDGKQFTLRDKLRQLYPDGLHLKYIGKTYSESWNESPDDAIDVGFPVERDGMSGGALMEPMKVVQDAYNDYMNAKRENYETGWSPTYFKGSMEQWESIQDQRSRPNDYILLKEFPPDAEIEGNIIYREPAASPPEGFDEAIQELAGPVSQDVTGALPALQGSAKATQTASGQAMDRSQAMGMLGPAWANLQRMFAGIRQKAALLASKNKDHGSEIVTVGGDGKNITIKLERLRKGKFHTHTSDSSFPESTASLRANLQDLIKMAAASPVGQTLFESPDNWEEFIQLNGNPDLVLIPAIAYKKQTRELELLLQEAPVIPTPQQIAAYTLQHAEQSIQAEGQGMMAPPFTPPVPEPSLKPEADDYHQWESAKCQEYLSSEDCWIRQNIGTPEDVQKGQLGVQNVRLHKALHDQFMQQQEAAKAQAMQQLKPPSESINFKDEPPAAKQAMNAQAGIHVAPEANPAVNKAAAAPGTKGTATV